MNLSQRPIFFYLFPVGGGIEIRELTDVAALALKNKGELWIDMPQKTMAEAEQLKELYLEKKR